MISSKPYLIRALYEWICDSDLTPYILLRTDLAECSVPMEHVKDNKIVFNIAESVVHGLILGNEAIEFKARFSGLPKQIYAPVAAVLSIYAKETGEGMTFPEEKIESQIEPQTSPKRGKPDLKIVK